jgi:hypothetical protein
VNVAVTGTIQADSLLDGILLEQWPLTANNQDDATVRAAGVVGTTPVLNKLVLSNGVDPTVPAYGTVHGQAYAATADGSWTTASGGPGGTLNRLFYEQFTIVAATTHTMRVDSLILSTSFYNTSSGTKMAVVYSKTGFRTDSTEISVAIKNGTPLTASTNGSFTNAFDVSNQTGGNPDVFALLLNGSAGVNMKSGDTLSFRIYHCTGSGSTIRYAKLKNVLVKGTTTEIKVAPPVQPVTPVMTINSNLQPFSQTLGRPTDAQAFLVTGTGLGAPVSITPPDGYEISVDSGKKWYNTNVPALLPNATNAVRTSVMVRLNAASSGNYERNVTVQTSGVAAINVPVTGIAYGAYSINPNPAGNYVNVYHANLFTVAVIRLYNLNGHLIGTHYSKPASNYTTINISALPNGMYFVELERLKEKALLKFIKQ